jgi:hypothetical protein
MTFIDSKGDQLSFEQVILEGLTAEDTEHVTHDENPETLVSAMEDAAYDEWELEKLYSRNARPFKEFFKEFAAANY